MRMDALSELITAARVSLVGLGQDTHPMANMRRANLEATIEAVQRELARAKKALDQARSPAAAAESLAKVKTQIREARPAAKLARAKDHDFDKDAAEAILASATVKAKKQKRR